MEVIYAMPVKSLELRAYVHATEDRDKVIAALKQILSDEFWKEAVVSEEVYEGHYGNPVIVLTATIRDPDKASRAFNNILSRLGSADRSILLESLEERVDGEGTLYFRVSKQDAYLGKLIVYEADDVVRISIRFSGRRKEALRDYRERLEEKGH